MIRLIIKGIYMMPTDKAETDFKTFDLELPEVESYLTQKIGYAQCGSREIIGAEIIDNQELHPTEKSG